MLAMALAVMMFPIINVSASYTEDNDVLTWDLTDIAGEIDYDETAFQNGAVYEYNGLTIAGKNSSSSIDENGVKIGKVSNQWGYIEYTPQSTGILSVTAEIGRSGSYYSKIYVETSATETSGTHIAGGESTGEAVGKKILEAGVTYYIYNNSSASAYIKSLTFTPDDSPVLPELTLNNTFSDNMLIQRDKPVVLKGTCSSIDSAVITLQNDNDPSDRQEKTITLSGSYDWRAELEPVSNYDDTYTLTITPSGSEVDTIVIENIIFGDLYLCAGQSNMVASASDYKNMGIDYTSEQLGTEYSDIRYLSLTNNHSYSASPKENIVNVSWKVLESGGIPAVAYSFAEKLYSETGIPVGLLISSVKGTYISQWLPNTGIDSNNTGKNLYNTGIYPFRDMQLSGILWYQGESDSRAHEVYKDKLISLIHTYRELFANTEEVPFYYVSIVRCGTYEEKDGMFEHMSFIRAMQTEVYKQLETELDNFGIIPTLDLYGNWENDTSFSNTWGTSRGNARSTIHPGQKPVIGQRAAGWVLKDVYGRETLNDGTPIITTGPIFKSAVSENGKIFAEYECTGDLKVMDAEQYSDEEAASKREQYGIDETKPQEFEVAGTDGVYYRADAELDGNKVIISSESVPEPVSFRYAYTGRDGDAYIECPNLTDESGLPALVTAAEVTASSDAPTDAPAPTGTPDTTDAPADTTDSPGVSEPVINGGRVLFAEDFSEGAYDTWEGRTSALSIAEEEDKGNYLHLYSSGQDCGVYTLFGETEKPVLQYEYECDVRLKAGNRGSTQLALMAGDYAFSSGNINYGVESGYIVKLYTTDSEEWTINPDTDNKTVTIANDEWVHLKVSCDSQSGTVWLDITNDGGTLYSGTVEPYSAQTTPVGIHLRGGRSYAAMDIDNIELTVLEDNRFSGYSEFKNENSVGIVTAPSTEGKVYAALYNSEGMLLGVSTADGSEGVQTLKFPVPDESGTYMKIFNWKDNMQPIADASAVVYVDDIDEKNSDYLLYGRSVYAFGDSIVYGHNAPENSFMQLIANEYDMELGMYAKNGATVVNTDSSDKEDASEETEGNYIIKQIQNAPDETPDVIVFDGYTNDAYGDPAEDSFNSNGSHINIMENLGEIQGSSATEFDNKTFCGGFEEIIYTMKQKWPDTPIVFVTIHKSGGRDFEIQSELRDLTLEMCEEWGVYVADLFNDTTLDTRDPEQMDKYIINGAGSHPNVAGCREFYIPTVVPVLKEAIEDNMEFAVLPDNINDTVDLVLFAGQSNMSGRGSAADAVSCDVNAGFEYKSVSDPSTLLPITEPFGLGEDREGGLTDINANGSTKRTGSMVSAFVNEYYEKTGRQIVAVSASMGGTNTSEWLGGYVNDAAERLDSAKTFLLRNGINIGRTFVVWCQGESDGDAKNDAQTYTENTKAIMDVLAQHGAERCFMIQIGHYNYEDYPDGNGGTTGAEWDEHYGVIRDAQAALCETDDYFVLAGSFEGYIEDMKDRYHYNQGTYNAVGAAAGAAAAEYYADAE